MNTRQTIMIADDVDMNRSVIKRFLSRDYLVLEACDGEEALEVLQENQVDALILDIIMPKMDGIEVLKRIRKEEKYSDMAILVATSTKEKTERMALEYGADDVVAKPYDPMVIRKRLENVMIKKQYERDRDLAGSSKLEAEYRQVFQYQYRERMLDYLNDITVNVDYMEKNQENDKVIAEGLQRIRQKSSEMRSIFEA